ncbi:MAG: Deoxyribodipyrimidine photo-lyase [Devosia sp.]|nr:Deoxyribodipyrimidine photo-lyase [Devosia sp.]
MTDKALVWLRNDLRLHDNPALHHAASKFDEVTVLYVEETDPTLRPMGAASRWWLHHSLNALGRDLAAHGLGFVVLKDTAAAEMFATIRAEQADAVFWNRRYGPSAREIDAAIAGRAKVEGLECRDFPGSVLVEPFNIATGTGKPYSVFGPYRKSLAALPIAEPLPAPLKREAKQFTPVGADYVAPKWSEKLVRHWRIGETAARERLREFLDVDLATYPRGRDFPGLDATSHLAPHLRFGEISPRQIWHAAQAVGAHDHAASATVEKFLSELSWRDFNYHQLYYRPDIANKPMVPKFAGLQWRQADGDLKAWQQGRTGFPIVDAGMRELWARGFMQNRVRMLTASLLTKNLLIDWRIGERWFWDCLCCADEANNPGNWQWVAGSGLDASPFFRIFNPVTQGERFDGEGDYVRRWVPELAKLPDAFVHEPGAAPAEVLRAAGVVLGETYPWPICDLKATRVRALEAARGL